jgi:hypothetical protein
MEGNWNVNLKFNMCKRILNLYLFFLWLYSSHYIVITENIGLSHYDICIPVHAIYN